MVAQAEGYYGEPFCVDIGVTQGEPLSPTSFTVVVDTVVRHWESLVAEREGGAEAMTMDVRVRQWGGQSRNRTTADISRKRGM